MRSTGVNLARTGLEQGSDGFDQRARRVDDVVDNEARAPLDVADDGRGFDPASRADPGPAGGLGLIGMRERAEGLGGSLAVESAIGEGTTIAVSLPAIPPNAAPAVEVAR